MKKLNKKQALGIRTVEKFSCNCACSCLFGINTNSSYEKAQNRAY